MISFFYETDFKLENEDEIADWIGEVIRAEDCDEGDISYVFCDDMYVHKINVAYLKHDTLTDIISFDYSLDTQLHGEIYISVDRVRENAEEYESGFENELHRVMAHGVLHYAGYNDKTEKEATEMRAAENRALDLRSFV